MNPYAVVILAALVLEFALHRLASFLNLRMLRSELPAEFRESFDAETYRRTQEYNRARTRFGLWPATFGLAVVLIFWGLSGFEAYDRALRGLGLPPIPTGILFIGGLVLARAVLFLPFSLYSTFVIEERFGFNRTNARTFWLDHLKGFFLGVLLGVPLLAAILFFFEHAGAQAWLWCWLATTVFLLAVQFIAPTWLMPLFNDFEPLEDGELKEAILGYGRSVEFPLEDIYVVDGSRRSTKANAFFTGFGKHKRVALFDTLIENQSTSELVGVVAHEIGHYKKKHILQGLVLSILNAGALFWLLSFFLNRPELFEAFGMQTTPVYAGLVFFGLLYTPIDMVLGVLLQAFSRKNEFEADAYAAQTTGRPEALAAALVKLSSGNLSNLTPHPLHVVLSESHPPLVRRLAALGALGSKAEPAAT